MRKVVSIGKARFSWLQILMHLGAWVPGLYLFVAYQTNYLTVNPIQELTIRSGFTALVLLVLSLACTPASTLFGWRQVIKLRRPLGLYAFGYALGHALTFLWLDYGLDLRLLQAEIIQKRYILVGASAFLILSVLAITSFQWWMVRLGKNWKRVHRLVYLAAPLVVIHFAWSQKGDILRLQGDIVQPLLFGLIVAVLLLVRVPGFRRRITGLGQGYRKPPPARHSQSKVLQAKKTSE